MGEQQIARLLEGIVLDDWPKRLAPPSARRQARPPLTLTEGKSPQVKRMLTAVGN